MVNKVIVNKGILIALESVFYALVMVSGSLILSSLYGVVSLLEYISFHAFLLVIYTIVILLTLNSRVMRIYLGLVGCIVSLGILILLLLVSDLLMFWPTKLILGGLACASGYSLYLSVRTVGRRTPTFRYLPQYGKLILIGALLLSGGILFFPIKSVTIDPGAVEDPEFYFWTSAASVPEDVDTLQFCAEHNIGFVVVIREHYIDDGGADEVMAITGALTEGVDIYINIGGPQGGFFLTTENAKEFPEIFSSIKSWAQTNAIYTDSHFKGFTVDAEPPIEFVEEMAEYNFLQKSQYFIDEIPSAAKMEEVQEDIEGIIEEVHEDDLEIGIVKMPSISDEKDGDNDYSRIVKCLYNLDLDWDFSVSMIYRTQHLPDLLDYMIEDVSKYDYTSDHQVGYSENDDLENYLMGTTQFFYKVSYARMNSEVGVPKEARYAFIGTFSSKFRDTSYIKQKVYKDDIDICLSAGMDKVFLYDYSGFRARYGVEELIDLVRHVAKGEAWRLSVPSYYFQRELIISVLYTTVDKLLYI